MATARTIAVVYKGGCRSCGASLRYRGAIGSLAVLPAIGAPHSGQCVVCGKRVRLTCMETDERRFPAPQPAASIEGPGDDAGEEF